MIFKNRIAPVIQRVFGAALLFFGVNKIFSLVPLPEKQGFVQLFLDTIANAGYIMPIIVVTQIGAGVLLLANRYVALALVVMFPISLNIFLFHVVNDPEGVVPATIFMVWNSILMIVNLPKYRPLLLAR